MAILIVSHSYFKVLKFISAKQLLLASLNAMAVF